MCPPAPQVATSPSTTQPTRLTALADSLGYVPATGASCTPRRWRCRRSRAKGRFGDLSPASGNGRRHREGKVDPRTLKSWETTRSPSRSIEPPIPSIPPAALQLGTRHLRCDLFEVFTPGCSNPNAMTRIGFPYGEHHKGKVFVGPHQQRATVRQRSALFVSSVARRRERRGGQRNPFMPDGRERHIVGRVAPAQRIRSSQVYRR